MRVLLVTPFYPPAWAFGGPVRAVAGLARALAKAGHTVTVWTSDALDRKERVRPGGTVAEEIEVVRFPTFGLRFASHGNLIPTPTMRRRALREIEDFDIVHLHDARSFQNAALLDVLIARNVPFVFSPHGSWPRRGRVALKHLYDALWGKRFHRAARRIVAVSQAEATALVAGGIAPERVRILSNAVELPSAEGSTAAREFHLADTLGLRRGESFILYLGRLHAIKGPDLLIEAYSRARVPHPLIIAGPDEGMRSVLGSRVEKLGLAGRVKFIGPVEGPLRDALLAQARLFVQPSRSEGQSMSLLESLAWGRPTLCTEACVFEPSLREAVHAVAATPEALAAGLIQALSDPSLGGQGRDLVATRYSPEVVAAAATKIYKEALA